MGIKQAKEIARLNAKIRKLERAQKRVGRAINKKQRVIARGGGTLKGAKKRVEAQKLKVVATKAKIAAKPAVTPAQQIKKERALRVLSKQTSKLKKAERSIKRKIVRAKKIK